MLHDDKGAGDSKAFKFGADDTIAAGATITLCKDAEGSFEFGIGGDDTVTLRDANGEMVDTSGKLGDQGALNYVWTRGSPAGDWGYVVVGTLAPSSAPVLLPLVWLNAVADKGSTDRCDGEDWVEFTNIGDTELVLDGYMLHDDKGAGDSKAFKFGADDTIAAGATITLCKDAEGSFEFGIGGDDTVTLRDANGEMVDTSGKLGDQGALNYVWTRGSPAGD